MGENLITLKTATEKSFDIPTVKNLVLPITVAVRSKAWVCGRSVVGIAGSNPVDPSGRAV
jgi:hypothetical protein